MTDHGRKADDALIELATSFREFKERYERDREADEEKEKDAYEHTMRWRNGFTERIGDFQKQLDIFKESIAPVLSVSKFLRWVFIVTGGTLFAALAKWSFEWFMAHFKS